MAITPTTLNQANVTQQAPNQISDVGDNISQLSKKIQAPNPSNSAFSKLLRHIWIWIKDHAIRFKDFISRKRSNPHEAKVFLRTSDGYMYDALKIEKDVLDELKKNDRFQFRKDTVKTKNPSAYADYLTFLPQRRADANPLLDKAIHSGNVLQILESAIELDDHRNIAYCSTFLQTLVTTSNQEELLALSKKYSLAELETYITENRFEVSLRPTSPSLSKLRSRLMKARSEEAVKKVLEKLERHLNQSEAIGEAATMLLDVLEKHPHFPTTLEDLMNGNNTRIPVEEIAPDLWKKLPDQVCRYFSSHYRSDENQNAAFQLLVQLSPYFPVTVFLEIKKIINTSSTDLAVRMALIQVMEKTADAFLGNSKLHYRFEESIALWKKEFQDFLWTTYSNDYCKRLFERIKAYSKNDAVALLTQLIGEHDEEIEHIILSDTLDENIYTLLARRLHHKGEHALAARFYTFAPDQISTHDRLCWAISLIEEGEKETAKEKLESISSFYNEEERQRYIDTCMHCAVDTCQGYTNFSPSTIHRIANAAFGFDVQTIPRITTNPNINCAIEMYRLGFRAVQDPNAKLGLFKEKVLPTVPLLREYQTEIENRLNSVPAEEEMLRVYAMLARRLHESGRTSRADQFYAFLSDDINTLDQIYWAASLTNQGHIEAAKEKLEELTDVSTEEEKQSYINACLACGTKYHEIYETRTGQSSLPSLLRSVVHFLAPSIPAVGPNLRAAMDMYQKAFDTAQDPDLKVQIFVEKIFPNMKRLHQEREFLSLGREFAGGEYPEISVLSYLEAMKLAENPQDFHAEHLLENLAIEVKNLYLRNPEMHAEKCITYLDEALEMIQDWIRVEQEYTSYFSIATQPRIHAHPSLIDEQSCWQVEVGASLHFIKGEIMLHAGNYSNEQIYREYDLAVRLAPHHPFGADGFTVVDGQASPSDYDNPSHPNRALAIAWGNSTTRDALPLPNPSE